MAHDAFISYSSKDKPTADAACALLEASGVRCWIAPRDILPGRDWGESIVDAIATSRVMVLIFSTHANQSPQVRREVERAVDKGCAIVPFRIENVPPSKSLEYFISVPHWMDAYGGPLDGHLARLAKTVTTLIQHGDVPPAGVHAADPARGRAPFPAQPARPGDAVAAGGASANPPPGAARKWTPRHVAVGAGVALSVGGLVYVGGRVLSPGPGAASADTRDAPAKAPASPATAANPGAPGGSATAPDSRPVPATAPAAVEPPAAERALAARRQQLETAAQAMKLSGIARIGRQQLCVIDGKYMREGDRFREFTIQKVLTDRVVLTADGMQFEIRPQPKAAEPAAPPAQAAPSPGPTGPQPGGPRYGPGGFDGPPPYGPPDGPPQGGPPPGGPPPGGQRPGGPPPGGQRPPRPGGR